MCTLGLLVALADIDSLPRPTAREAALAHLGRPSVAAGDLYGDAEAGELGREVHIYLDATEDERAMDELAMGIEFVHLEGEQGRRGGGCRPTVRRRLTNPDARNLNPYTPTHSFHR